MKATFMKKAIAFILIIVLALSCAACSGNSKEQMVKNSQVLDLGDLFNEIENDPQAKDNYKGGTYLITGKVYQVVNDDYCDLTTDELASELIVRAYLSKSDLLEFEKEDTIQVVGKITDITISTSVIVELKDAFYVGKGED